MAWTSTVGNSPRTGVGWEVKRTRIGGTCAASYCSGRSEERRVGKECRSLCDWSSDVCSSDLYGVDEHGRKFTEDWGWLGSEANKNRRYMRRIVLQRKIGRASCRERV